MFLKNLQLLANMSRKEKSSKMLRCTACPKGLDAEQLHPELQVPICGACAAQLKDADQILVDGQKISCTWCGNADELRLAMCDTCVRSFCYGCIARNFGSVQAEYVKTSDPWSCYVCAPTSQLKQLQNCKSAVYFNIDKAYAAVHPPRVEDLENNRHAHSASLTPEELRFASIFLNVFNDVVIQGSDLVSSYLTAVDLSVLHCLSRGLRSYFMTEVTYTPGLFRTEYGEENQCRLYDHQIVSLSRMTQIENSSNDFGALRGGIFGDEPGLGKTVTTLALISSTAGLLPQKPGAFWNRETINEHWQAKRGHFEAFLGPMLNSLQKMRAMGKFESPGIHHLRRNIEQYCTSIREFETQVKSIIKAEVSNPKSCSMVLNHFREHMIHIREGLDPSNRKISSGMSPTMKRARFERNLRPTAATLIVVPTTLLEHWYEQINRHLNLHYLTQEEDRRGVAYLDGLGDIVDVHAPLAKLNMSYDSVRASDLFSRYLIVVTTFERVAKMTTYGTHNSPFLKLRWLRLIVDEGHEIGKSDTDVFAQRVTQCISQIAAERRWVMSGTPTTGANSEQALAQLYRIFQFLRHPRIAVDKGTQGKTGSSAATSSASSTEAVSTRGTRSAQGNQTAMKTADAIASALTHEAEDFIGSAAWHKQMVEPCLAQEEKAWKELISLLKGVLLRHTKADIHLFEPIRSNVNLDLPGGSSSLRGLSPEDRARAIDQCKAEYICNTMRAARREWKRFINSNSMVNINSSRRRSILHRLHQSSYHERNAGAHANTRNGSQDGFCESDRTSSESSSASTEPEHWTQQLLAQTNINKKSSGSTKLCDLTPEEQEVFLKGRCPKAIVFSQHDWDLQGVGHCLILMMGPSAICEHTQHYRSSELSRFRHSKRRYRKCPMCGHCNQITNGDCCSNILLLVEYENVVVPFHADHLPTPQPGGHGRHNPGGHYRGRCLCSPNGCEQPPDWKGSNARGSVWCDGYPNPFFEPTVEDQQAQEYSSNHAIVSYEHIHGYIPGQNFAIGDHVVVRRQEAYNPDGSSSRYHYSLGANDDTQHITMGSTDAVLWRGGVLGGIATVRGWRTCGGRGSHYNWHGSKILTSVPWTTEEEEASILMLKEDGSTGLDLSFATHIFMLDRVRDPALRNQIISRAHRMGATGPVQVQLVQVCIDDEDGDIV
mmetsp:Transcript_47799/g.94636  ORF Transcript_47799/g.94636 Transcript_47799/m.94636 type:complete len:1169 (-) Transcript_47799:69-3575(-)